MGKRKKKKGKEGEEEIQQNTNSYSDSISSNTVANKYEPFRVLNYTRSYHENSNFESFLNLFQSFWSLL